MTGHATRQHVLLECPGICQRVNTVNPQFLTTDSPEQFGNSLLLDTSLVSSDNSAVCHTIIARSTDSEAVELAIIGFNIAICHSYDEEVGGPLKGPLKDPFKKGRFYFIKTNSPKSCRPSQCSRRARASFLCRTRLRRVPPPIPTATTLQRKE